MKNFITMAQDNRGASAAEYAIILATIGSAIALAAIGLGGGIATSMNRSKNCIANSSLC